MVTLYVADIERLPDPVLVPEVLQTLPWDRQKRIHNMKQEKSRKQSMGAGLLLQKVLALYHMQDTQMIVGEHGKPMIEGLEFSLSHSGNLVVCVVSDKPVGCDVEEIRKAPQGIAKRYFTLRENSHLSRFWGEEYDKEFFRLWTMKESYAKMTGEGLAQVLGKIEVVVDEQASVFRDGKSQECFLQSVELEGHVVSVCVKAAIDVQMIWVDLELKRFYVT